MGTVRLFNHPIKQTYLLLALLEGALLAGAFYLAVHLRFRADPVVIAEAAHPLWPRALLFVAVIMLCMTATGLYNRRIRDQMAGLAVRLGLSFLMAIPALTVVFYALPEFAVGRGALALSLVLSLAFLVMTRMFF
ncbi:hypothetical protein [Alkalilimnicola ehrlichii]|uniref:hypothetical protein n=1 Tax=Alkalilimnicola ehrlichii TaxID=351052 RepID=UPI002161F991|nr:hypothetical protein [Alkalilimnicola ehrlichii]